MKIAVERQSGAVLDRVDDASDPVVTGLHRVAVVLGDGEGGKHHTEVRQAARLGVVDDVSRIDLILLAAGVDALRVVRADRPEVAVSGLRRVELPAEVRTVQASRIVSVGCTLVGLYAPP